VVDNDCGTIDDNDYESEGDDDECNGDSYDDDEMRWMMMIPS